MGVFFRKNERFLLFNRSGRRKSRSGRSRKRKKKSETEKKRSKRQAEIRSIGPKQNQLKCNSPLPRCPLFIPLNLNRTAPSSSSHNSLDHALAAERRRLHAQQRSLVGEFRVQACQLDGRAAPGIDCNSGGSICDSDGRSMRREAERREGCEEHRRAGHRSSVEGDGQGKGKREELKESDFGQNDVFFFLSLSLPCQQLKIYNAALSLSLSSTPQWQSKRAILT